MQDRLDHDRRRFLGAAAMTIGTAGLGLARPAGAMSPPPGWGPLKQVDAGPLNVAYAELGPAGGPPVLLLHGWPYDIHAFAEVAPILAARGFRVIAPYLRGYGPTRFLSAATVRNGQPAALAGDAVA